MEQIEKRYSSSPMNSPIYGDNNLTLEKILKKIGRIAISEDQSQQIKETNQIIQNTSKESNINIINHENKIKHS